MAQDPYGFPDTAPATLGGGTGTGSDATRAMWFGLTAALLGSIGICVCYVPYLVAFPMGIYAAILGSRALHTVRDENERAMATSGLVGGVLSGLVGGMFSLFFLLYALFFLLYFGVIILAVVAGAVGAANQ